MATAAQIAWREAHKDELAAKQRARYEADRDRILARNAQYRAAHQEQIDEYQRRYRELHPGKQVARNRKKLYGLTEEQFSEMVVNQNNKCLICKRNFMGTTNGKAHVDHDHDNGKVRGLLCGHCNMGLGQFKEDPERLVAAAAYLIQHSEESNGND